MRPQTPTVLAAALTFLVLSCHNNGSQKPAAMDSSTVSGTHTYASDDDFLGSHTKDLVELQSAEGAKILVSGAYQGRVMTSSALGDSGLSYGWVNYGLIASGEKKKQFNAVGGENRLWLGPEGGQYSIYFKPGDSFNIAHWQVPSFIDTESYDIRQASQWEAVFTRSASFINYSGTHFDIAIERKVTMVERDQAGQKLKQSIPDSIHFVGYETSNTITNTGDSDWKKEKGLLSIWLLGMFQPTPQTVVIIPFHPGKNARSLITDDYFGNIPADRLSVKDSVLFFTCDGKFRSKIGLSPLIAKPIAASFDAKNNVLTLVIPSIDKGGTYVNSKWEIQKEPYKGDVINAYNDGPLTDGTQLGPFYEIESSSPAKELKKGESMQYSELTCHLQGDYNSLRQYAKQLLHVDLNDLAKTKKKRR